jgi:hypothetical protein
MASVESAIMLSTRCQHHRQRTHLLPVMFAVQRAAAIARACGAASAAHQMPYPSQILQICMSMRLQSEAWLLIHPEILFETAVVAEG